MAWVLHMKSCVLTDYGYRHIFGPKGQEYINLLQ